MPTLTRADLHEYQTRAVDAIKTKRRYMLALEMGLGQDIQHAHCCQRPAG
jgi:hypothetical protein